ncbi:hypothetical protein LTR04_000220 [Oleoguttula sp. CCFEE 6159]|nr:hypothetical protein LTR04_000220 [Oleoguttula sp. CCFEE 6159]
MPKSTTSDSRNPARGRRQKPLAEEYAPSHPLKQKIGKRKKSRQDGDDGEAGAYVDSQASRKILKHGRDLAAEDDAENSIRRPLAPNPAFAFESRAGLNDGLADDEGQGNVYIDGAGDDDDEAWGDEEEEEVEEIEIDPSDLDVFNRFNPEFDPATLLQPAGGEGEESGSGTNLTDLILEKIAAHEAEERARNKDAGEREIMGGGRPEDAVEIPAKALEVFTQVGNILSRYKSGALPKPFKLLPTLPQWEVLLDITTPLSWTPNAVYEATRIFVSSTPLTAQIFIRSVLLEHVRSDLSPLSSQNSRDAKKSVTTRTLNVHLYKALKKALYKPAAWFKGLLFPLLASGTCTLREAHIIASVLARVSVPVLHSAAALHRLCDIAAEQMLGAGEAAGATNIFIRTLLEKKYALPYKVVDALVFHFLRFRPADTAMAGMSGVVKQEDYRLPVLWHQCLLAFAQRYRNDITEDQREALLDLLLVRGHRDIGPEVRRELLEGRGRGVMLEPMGADGGDDTMVDV